jgi:predicted O-methyltransferase YrrM
MGLGSPAAIAPDVVIFLKEREEAMSRSKAAVSLAVASAIVGGCLLMAQRRRAGGLGNQPLAKDAAEKLILATSEQVPERMNVPLEDGRLIRMLTESIGAKHAVEVGTSTGYSGLWFALALRKTGGKLTTFEIDPDVARTARGTFAKAGVSDLITVVVGDAHETISKLEGPIDIVFIDADKPGYRDYLDKLLPLVRPGGLILAHNIFVASNNPKYAEGVTTNPDLDTTVFTTGNGMTITLKKR